jgi:hypothetical protein
VNAADYTTWRNHSGEAFQLTNEAQGVTPGNVTIEDYTQWKMHYGESVNLGTGFGVQSVPEPSGACLVLFGTLAAFSFPRMSRG